MPEATEGARTLDRGLAVLEAVVGGAARLEDVAERTGLSRSAVHRLLTTLTQRGYLQQVAGEGWRAGFGLIELAGQAEQHLDPARVLQEAIEDIAVQVQDSVHVGVLQGSQVVYVAKAQGARTLQLISHVGLRLPAQNTALGRALYAADVEGAVATFDPTLTQTPRSVRTAEEFARVLTETRERGYGIDDEESTLASGRGGVRVHAHGVHGRPAPHRPGRPAHPLRPRDRPPLRRRPPRGADDLTSRSQ
jgi:IclR family acetate operon transcriptional repressor